MSPETTASRYIENVAYLLCCFVGQNDDRTFIYASDHVRLVHLLVRYNKTVKHQLHCILLRPSQSCSLTEEDISPASKSRFVEIEFS